MTAYTSTFRTMLGFLRSLVGRRLGLRAGREGIEGIYNYLPIEGLFVTSGQPDERQLVHIRDAGFDTVINLAPTSVLENSVVEEAEILDELGLKYVHIPVDFKDPTEDDFARFVREVSGVAPDRLWVHCAANMRVSAFTYRYRREVLKEDEAVARAGLEKIWEPLGVWKDFVQGR